LLSYTTLFRSIFCAAWITKAGAGFQVRWITSSWVLGAVELDILRRLPSSFALSRSAYPPASAPRFNRQVTTVEAIQNGLNQPGHRVTLQRPLAYWMIEFGRLLVRPSLGLGFMK